MSRRAVRAERPLHPGARNWLEVCELLRDGATGAGRLESPSKPQRDVCRQAWACMREARIYALPEEAWATVRTWAFGVVGHEWCRGLGIAGTDEEQARALEVRMEEYLGFAGTFEGTQDRLALRTPFPWTYLAYASGCDLSGPDRRARWGDRADAAGWTRARLLGHLLARDAGDCFEFALHLRDGHWGLALDVVRADGAWTRTPTGRSLALPLLLEAVTERAFCEPVEDRAFARAYRASTASRGAVHPVPPPYYEVRIEPRRILRPPVSRAEGPGGGWRLDHRIDVAGHRRILLRRGRDDEGSLGAGEALRWAQRGYRILRTRAEADEELRSVLDSRGVTWEAGGWVAVRTTRVREHTRGPEDAPVVPATRVVT